MAVAEPVLLLTPELDGEGRLEGDLLRPHDDIVYRLPGLQHARDPPQREVDPHKD